MKFNAIISVKDPLTRFVSMNGIFWKVGTRVTVCLKKYDFNKSVKIESRHYYGKKKKKRKVIV